MWGLDVPVVPPDQALRQFTVVALGFVAFGFLCTKIVPDRPAVAREYPFSGLVTELGGLEENKVHYIHYRSERRVISPAITGTPRN